jgi:hypothetical protein
MDDSGRVAGLIRDDLARERLSREAFAHRTRLGKSTVVYTSALDQTDTVRSGAVDGPLQDASVGRAPVKPGASGAPLRGYGA